MNRNFRSLLEARWAEGKSVCVGLDSELGKIPESARRQTTGRTILNFNEAIIDATKDAVCAYKPNVAFY
ncbi:MAG: orotidine 5'-phosphate decarboxylase, partial [Patescibacteria group bacterium]